MTGTLVATSLIVLGRNKYALNEILGVSQISYYFLQFERFALAVVEALITYYITYKLPVTIAFVIVRCIVAFLLTIGIDWIFFKNKPEMKYFIKHFESVLSVKKRSNK